MKCKTTLSVLLFLALFISCKNNSQQTVAQPPIDSQALAMPEPIATTDAPSIRSFAGVINEKYPVEMTLTVNGSEITGTYYYVKNKSVLEVKGIVGSDGKAMISEYDNKGNVTGIFEGELDEYIFEGEWTNAKKSVVMPFKLNNKLTGTVTESKEAVSEPSEIVETGNRDWDQFLSDYEKYTDQYISLLKKAKKNDLSAFEEYPALYQKALDIQKDLDKAKDDNSLSPSQMERFLKIQNKMLKAAEQLN